MILYLPGALLAAGTLVAYTRSGRGRVLGTLAMLAAVAWSLALLVDPGTVTWLIGPALATLLLRRPAARVPSNFDVLTRRSVSVAVSVLLAVVIAAKLPVGENPLLLYGVPWQLAAVGVAWFVRPIDQLERLQGVVLVIAGLSAVLLAAVPAGALTAALAGGMAFTPVVAERRRLHGTLRPAITSLLMTLALAAAALAIAGPTISSVALADFSISLAGPIPFGLAILLVAGAAGTAIGFEWVALLGVLGLTAVAPSVRWPALAALVAVACGPRRGGERPAWIAIALLSLTTPLSNLLTPPSGPRAQAVALAGALVLTLFAARAGMIRSLLLPAMTFVVIVALGSVNASNLGRFQWVAAIGALVIVARSLLVRVAPAGGDRVIIRDQLLAGLLLLAVSARDPLFLGELGATLLVLDLAVVRIDDAPSSRLPGWAARLIALARSNWPPAVTFAGSTLAVMAALQADLLLGLIAALMFAGVQLAPLLDRHALAPPPERPRSVLAWIGPVLSIASGVAPALVLRMLRV